MLVRPIDPLPALPPYVSLNGLTRHDDIGHAVIREVCAHLACASPGIGEDDYSRAKPTGERIVAPDGLKLCKHFRIAVSRTVRGEFERETRGETVQTRGDETGHRWMVSVKVGGKSSGDGCGGEYKVEWIVEGDWDLGLAPVIMADGRDGISPRSSDVT